MKIAVIGYGRVGRAIVDDLVFMGHTVCVLDYSAEIRDLEKKPNSFESIVCNALSENNLFECTKDCDLIVSAVPGHVGYEVAMNIAKIGKNFVDISFFPEDPSPLKKLVEEKEIVGIIDAGLAPGMWNMMLADAEINIETQSCICYVGGLPKVPKPPFGYQAPYNPKDVLEMYTRECRYIQDGKFVKKPAMTDLEIIKIKDLTFEAFNTDGLRTMLRGMKTPTIIEKTLRYPGLANIMKMFRDVGFLNDDLIYIPCDGVFVSPIRVFEELVFPHWSYKEDEVDITVMQVIIHGEIDGEDVRRVYMLYDEAKGGFSSMARTTGYTATAVVNLVSNNIFDPGFYAPEDVGRVAWPSIQKYLQDRNINIEMKEHYAG